MVLYEAVTNAQGEKAAGSEQHRLRLEDGDLFILGPESNQLFLHALVKHPLGEAYPERISVIFRDIHTFLDSHHVGVFEGAMKYGELDGTVTIRVLSASDADLFCDWRTDK